MTKPADQSSDIAPAMREAIAWVVRLQSGEATEVDAEELVRWRSECPANQAAFKEAVRLWRGFEAAGATADESLTYRPADSRFTRRAMLAGAIAAGGAGVMIVRPPLDLWPSLRELSADYRTGKGEQRQVKLGPNISLRLNTLTSIAVDSKAGQPRIELISGEAVIDVAMSSQDPLVLVAGDGQVRARRAKFDARCIDGVTSITCLEGSLDISQKRHTAQLDAGQRLAYSIRDFGKNGTVDLAQATSWETGMLTFRDQTLSAVVDEINRYRPGRIIVVNGNLAQRVVNATFQVGHLDNFLLQARQLFGAKVTALPGGIVLLG
ncbi:MAG: FecR domain-containing protein [Pseudomonadota bacterium]